MIARQNCSLQNEECIDADSTSEAHCGTHQSPSTHEEDLTNPTKVIADYCNKDVNICHNNSSAKTYEGCIEFETQQYADVACDPEFQSDHMQYLNIIYKQPCGDCTDSDYGDFSSKEECDASWDDRFELLYILMEACM